MRHLTEPKPPGSASHGQLLRSLAMKGIEEAFFDVFGLERDRLTDALSPDSFDGWDSLSHIRLVDALEDKLGLQFTNEEIMDMVNVGAIRALVERRRSG